MQNQMQQMMQQNMQMQQQLNQMMNANMGGGNMGFLNFQAGQKRGFGGGNNYGGKRGKW